MQPTSTSFGLSLGAALPSPPQTEADMPAAPSTGTEVDASRASSESKPAPPSSLQSLLVPGLAIFAIFYFVLIRPEKKKQQSRKSMLESIKKGTKVMTTSGLYGSVAQVKDDVITLQVADGVRLRFNRAAIQDIIDPEASSNSDGKDKEAVSEKG